MKKENGTRNSKKIIDRETEKDHSNFESDVHRENQHNQDPSNIKEKRKERDYGSKENTNIVINRKPIRVGRSRVIRNARKKRIRKESSGEIETFADSSYPFLRSSKLSSDKERSNGHSDHVLLSDMISLLESRKVGGAEELEKLRAETEELKAGLKTLKRKLQVQKSDEIAPSSPLVRVPAMSCSLGRSLFSKPEENQTNLDEETTSEDVTKKAPSWWSFS